MDDLDDSGMTEDDLQKLILAAEHAKGLYPEDTPRDSLLKVFREILQEVDRDRSSKIANLTEAELGLPILPVRTYKSLAVFARSEGLGTVSQYLEDKAHVANITSLGKLAVLLKMPFTVRRESKMIGARRRTQKRSMFGGETNIIEGEEQ